MIEGSAPSAQAAIARWAAWLVMVLRLNNVHERLEVVSKYSLVKTLLVEENVPSDMVVLQRLLERLR